jgi:multidrug efflux pump subunit AcrA (membrane-fusion protein)
MSVDAEKMSFEQLRMIENDIAMLQQDLTMADGDVAAKEVSYRAVRVAIEGSSVIVAPQSGTVSSILKKPGDYVMPGTPVAVITGTQKDTTFVRMRIPNNIKTPKVGEILSVVRTGFPQDVREVKLIGIGSALDETGAVMADALLLEPTDWPIGASVRILAPRGTDTLLIKLSSLWWDADGKPNVWIRSDAGRVYGKQLIVGRTIGFDIEVYEGLERGDHYIVKPTPGIMEDMLLEDVRKAEAQSKSDSAYDEAMRAMGHDR